MKTNLVDCSTHGFVYSPSSKCPFCQESFETDLGSKLKRALAPKPKKITDSLWFSNGAFSKLSVFNYANNS